LRGLVPGGITEQARALWSMHASGERKKTQHKPPVRIEEKMDSLLVSDSVSFSSTDTTLLQTELALTAQFVQLASANKGVVTHREFLLARAPQKNGCFAVSRFDAEQTSRSLAGEDILD
jgi:hypothetical protein